jgi:hypothetical protein
MEQLRALMHRGGRIEGGRGTALLLPSFIVVIHHITDVVMMER